MTVSTEQIKELRAATGVGVLDCRKALEDANGDFDRAVEMLREKGLAKAAKRADRVTPEGVLDLYSHGNGRVGVMVEVNCETDFVARSEAFRKFAHEISLQVAAAAPHYIREEDIPESVLENERNIGHALARHEGKPESVGEKIAEGRIHKLIGETCLYKQPYIRDENITIQDLLHQNIAAIGENIVIRRFVRWEVGEEEI